MIVAMMTAFTVSLGLSVLLSKASGRWQVLDIPNHRSLHTRPTPRSGGIAILLGAAGALLVTWLLQGILIAQAPLLVAIAILAIVALIDDRHALGPAPRLLMQIIAVSVLLLADAPPTLDTLVMISAALFLMWMINLYNFMDGMDGFAGGMAVIGFGTFALLAWQAGYPDLALGCAVIVAAAGGFLLLNFPPARLFMGDTGSTVLGLLAGVVILTAHREAILPVWLGILVFSPFIIDASITISRRLLRGEKFWQAHKSHYYQRLVESGWGHRRTVLAEYVLMIACSASAVAAASQPLARQTTIIAGWAVIYTVIIYSIHRVEQRREPQT